MKVSSLSGLSRRRFHIINEAIARRSNGSNKDREPNQDRERDREIEVGFLIAQSLMRGGAAALRRKASGFRSRCRENNSQ